MAVNSCCTLRQSGRSVTRSVSYGFGIGPRYLEALDAGDHGLGEYAVFGDGPVGLLIFLAQRVILAAFLGHRRLAMEFGQAHVVGIDDGFRLGMQPDSGPLEQAKVVTAPRVVGKADDPAGRR